MKINLNNAKIQVEIDLFDIFDSLSSDEKKTFIEAFSCNDIVIKHVTDQILDGYTENGWCGAYGTSSNEIEHLPELQKSRIRISESLSELAEKQIKMLQEKNERLASELESVRRNQWGNYANN